MKDKFKDIKKGMREDKGEDDETTDEDEVKVNREEDLEEKGKGTFIQIGKILFIFVVIGLVIYCVRRRYKKRQLEGGDRETSYGEVVGET